MLAQERRDAILRALLTSGAATVAGLAGELGVSEMTIRRDLDTLASRGVLRRVHGGAKSLVLRGENPGYGQRELEGQDAKARIAAGVAGLLQDREHVWLDSGTTATGIARQLRTRDLTLMPMSLPALNALTAETQGGHRPGLLVPGGSLIPGELCFRGPLAEANIRSLRFDTAVVTPCAINLRDGLLAHDLDDAAVKRAGLESAGRVIAACAGSKWNAAAVALVAPLDSVDIIVTDRSFSPQELTELGKHSVKVVNV